MDEHLNKLNIFVWSANSGMVIVTSIVAYALDMPLLVLSNLMLVITTIIIASHYLDKVRI